MAAGYLRGREDPGSKSWNASVPDGHRRPAVRKLWRPTSGATGPWRFWRPGRAQRNGVAPSSTAASTSGVSGTAEGCPSPVAASSFGHCPGQPVHPRNTKRFRIGSRPKGGRVSFEYPALHACWLPQIESRGSNLERQALRRTNYTSYPARVYRFARHWNRLARAFAGLFPVPVGWGGTFGTPHY
jgi:hypothetical protein